MSAALALILSGATRSEAGESYPIWWSPALEVESIDKVEERLARPLWAHGEGIEVFKGGRDTAPRAVMDTCRSMLALRAQGYEPPGYRPYMLMDHQLAWCRAIEALKEVRPARKSFVRNFKLDHAAADRLPAMVGVASGYDWMCRQDMANKKRIPWSSLDEVSRVEVKGEDEIKVFTETSVVRVVVLGRGDFNGDGLDDLMIRSSASAVGGTWSGADMFLLSRETDDRTLWVLRASQHFPPGYRCEKYYDYPEVLQ